MCGNIKSILNFVIYYIIHRLYLYIVIRYGPVYFAFLLQVSIQFYHLVGDCELPVLEMGALGLGTEAEFRTFDLKGSAFLKELWLKCPEYLGKTIKICTLFS